MSQYRPRRDFGHQSHIAAKNSIACGTTTRNRNHNGHWPIFIISFPLAYYHQPAPSDFTHPGPYDEAAPAAGRTPGENLESCTASN